MLCEFCTTRTGPGCDVMDGARAVISCLVQLSSEAFPASIILPSIVLQAFRLLAACLSQSIYSRYIYINTVYTLCVTVYLWDSAKLGRSKINKQNEQAVNQNNPSCCSVGCCECTVALRGHTATQRSAVSFLEKKFNYYNMNEEITQTQKWINKLLSEEDEVPEHC